MWGIFMTSSSLQVAQVVGHVDGVLPERLQGHHVEGALVGGGQHYRGGAAFAVGLEPVRGGDAPAVAWHEAGEPVLGYRRRQVVADGALVLQELGGHDGADGVPAEVLGPGRAAAVAVEAGERVGAARFERAPQHVVVRHRHSIPLARKPKRRSVNSMGVTARWLNLVATARLNQSAFGAKGYDTKHPCRTKGRSLVWRGGGVRAGPPGPP